MRSRLLVLHTGDTVAVALERLSSGMEIQYDDGGTPVVVAVQESIDPGHKVALRAVQVGERVFKYGQCIGVTTRPIAPGQHVHVHNLVGQRGRGDLAGMSGETGGTR